MSHRTNRAATAYRKSMLTAPSYSVMNATATAMPKAPTRSSFASQSGQHLLLMAILPEYNSHGDNNEVEKLGVHSILPTRQTLRCFFNNLTVFL